MTIKPHAAFEVITPDTVAECWDGVFGSGNLYERLWSMVDLYDESYRENIEDIGPHDVVGINSVASFWDKFTEEERELLNALAERNDREWEEMIERRQT